MFGEALGFIIMIGIPFLFSFGITKFFDEKE